MAKIVFIVLVFLYIVHNILGSSLGKCVQESPCVCKFNEYSSIDLSEIVGEKSYLVDSVYTEDNGKGITKTNVTEFFFSGCKNATFDNYTFAVLIEFFLENYFLTLLCFSYFEET